MDIELYIANKLCDLGNLDLGIRLQRVFFKPTELNSKDAQKSYSITLPATSTNNEIFSYINVEEVGNKFRIYPDAKLYVGGVLILDGKFRLSEIGRDSYIGNLGVPKLLDAKDVFGDTMLNKIGSWKIDNFSGFKSVSEYNEKVNSPVIFPLALYGLLSKLANNDGSYSPKNVYDKSVNLDLEDFLPSINCIEMLKKIFSNSGYTLSGTALTDSKLRDLYMSYKNPNEYEFDWGVESSIIKGSWRPIRYNEDDKVVPEMLYYYNKENDTYAVNIFDSLRNIFTKREGNVTTLPTVARVEGITTVDIKATGLYKINMIVDLKMTEDNITAADKLLIGTRIGNLTQTPIEVHLVKNLRQLDEVIINNKFSLDNINQSINDPNAIFPQPNRVNFIDPKINNNLLCGFSFGRHSNENYRNPLNPDNCNPIAISGGRSWDFNSGNGVVDRAYSAVYSPSYQTREMIDKDVFSVDLNANTETIMFSNKEASGVINQVVWLEKGDKLSLLTITPKYRDMNGHYIIGYDVDYSIEIEPFRHNQNWLKVDDSGSSTAPMNWNDDRTFTENQIDLIKALPSEVKANDWIDNFCKAFNLVLHNTGGNNFNLDIKDKGTVRKTSIIIDLDQKANVRQSTNKPLDLPYMYELGFTVDTSEEGYIESITEFNAQGEPILTSGDNGGGIFETGSISTSKVTQTSNFSYCWYKDIEYARDGSILNLPVITDAEIWEHDYDTKEMLSKLYLDKGQRFWYKSGVKELDLGLNRTAKIALVSNTHNGNSQTLNYKDRPNTIMSNYFLLLTNSKYYTEVECYLTPEEYSKLDIALIRFNGDLYNVAEIDGYDPLGRRKAKLKLIRKI